MVKYLSSLRNKKGFTIVELVVVVAIIAVLTAMLMINMLDRESAKKLQFCENAQTFMSAAQLTMTRAQYSERELVRGNTELITYTNAQNRIVGEQYLYLEVKFDGSDIEYLHGEHNVNDLLARAETDAMTGIENYLAGQLALYLTDSYNGYFYAYVDEGFKVVCTHYSDYRLEDALFDGDCKIKGNIVGTCSDVYTMGAPAQKAFLGIFQK